MIRFAKDRDIPGLMEIWQEAFSDSDEATELIFELLNKPENMLVFADDDGSAVSMLAIREFDLTSPYTKHKAAYIYGVATDKAQRGNGYGTRLMEDAHRLLSRRGCVCSVLVPAEKSLFDFYGSRGYETAFTINKAEFSADEIAGGASFPLLPLSEEKYVKIRDARFADSRMFVCWGEDYISYIMQESAFYGGGMYYSEIGGKQICVTCYRDGDTVYVKELGATITTVDAVIRSVKACFNPARMVIYMREDIQISYTNNILPFGMVKWYDNKVKSEISASKGGAPYIGHVLD